MSTAAYVNPFAGAVGLVPERIDQGQDFAARAGTVAAIGRARIVDVIPGSRSGWEGEPYLYYQLLEGPDKGKLVYVAEGISPLVRPGQEVHRGQAIASFVPGSSTGIETGWASSTPTVSQAASLGASGGAETPSGASFASFLRSLGVAGQPIAAGASSGKGDTLFHELFGTELIPGETEWEVAGTKPKNPVAAAESAPGEAASQLASGLFGIVKPVATKFTLYAVLILGAVAMMIFGLSELLKPVGGPDLKRGLAGVAKAGAAA